MNKIKITYLLLSLFIALVSCEHDHLYYANKETATLRVHLDWSKAELFTISFDSNLGTNVASPNTPNGVTAIVYESNTGKYVGEFLSNTPDSIDIELPIGVYDVLIYNNSEKEHFDIGFEGKDNLNTYFAFAEIINGEAWKTHRKAKEPNDIASVQLNDVSITADDIEVYYNRPDMYVNHIAKDTLLFPLRRVEEVILRANVEGLKYAQLPPYTYVRGLSQGYYLGQELKCEIDSVSVAHGFNFNNRWFDPATADEDGTLTHRFNTFGLFTDREIDYAVDLAITLINGEVHNITVDVPYEGGPNSKPIDWVQDAVDGVWKHYIEIDIKLPNVIANGDETFDPNVEDWRTENVYIEF